jgi:3-oxoacyl-[acyl-carrier protein] reductase
MTTIDLTGKTALVTGGNVGIGKSIALALAGAGADVALTYRTHDGTETVDAITALGRKAALLPMDAMDSAAVRRAVDAAATQLGGRIDILVNNAGGMVGRTKISEMTDEFWRQVIDLNLSSTFYCTREVLRYMTGGWGRIVNIASLAGENGGGVGAIAYATAKAGMIGMTRGLAKELAPRGILVNAVAPGLILDTPFHERFTPPDAQRAIIESIPLKRPGLPHDVAGVVLFLASDLAGFVTGDSVGINGGVWFS